MNATRRDPGGPVVAVCVGPRCSALQRTHEPHAGLEPLREAVKATRGGLLVSSGCLGRCHLASLVMLGWRGPVGADLIPLSGMENPDRAAALADWLPGPGPESFLLRAGPLPAPLAGARSDADQSFTGRYA
jgi:hypothetical protein